MNDRIIAGTVNGDGTIASGQDFSVSRTSKGHYVVSFRPAFSSLSGASSTQIYSEDGDTRDNVVFIRINATELYLKTGDSGGDSEDRSFSFVATGTGSVALDA